MSGARFTAALVVAGAPGEPDLTIDGLAPVLWWKLDEASGTTAANSGSSGATHDGTASGGATFGGTTLTPGSSAATSLDADGTTGNVTVAGDPIIGDVFSIGLLFELDAAGGTLLYHGETGVSAESIAITIDGSGNLQITATTPDGLTDFGISIEPDAPGFVGNGVHQLVMMFEANEVRIVIDGDDALDTTWLDRTTFGSSQTYTTQPFSVGALDDGTDPIDGRIAHAFVTSTTLTIAEAISIWVAAGYDVPPEFYGEVDGAETPDGPEDVTTPEFVGEVDGAETPDGPVGLVQVIVVGGVDGAETPSGPSASEYIDPASVDGATPVVGPVMLLTSAPAPEPYVPVASVSLWDRTGTTMVADLAKAFDVRWQDVHSDTGIGSFSIALSDPQAALVAEGQLVRCSIYGLPDVFTWRVESNPRDTIQQSEEVGQVLVATGRGHSCRLDPAKVYPRGGVAATPLVDQRSFSFASPDFTAPGWSASSVVLGSFGDLTLPWRGVIGGTVVPAPFGWPELTTVAKWIWAGVPSTAVGSCYFRRSFVLASEQAVTIIATADNYWTLYLDGVSIIGDNSNLGAWHEHRRVTVTLAAGTHWFAAVVNNPSTSPAGFLCAAYIENADPELAPTMVLVSDAAWSSLYLPAVEPGFTPGEIMLTLLAEAQSRGQLTDVTVDFTATVDSGGVAWSTVPEVAVPVGASLLEVLGLLVSSGWVDWWMAPATPRLSMWALDGRGVNTAVEFDELVNITDLQHGQAQSIINRLLVKYPGGLFVVDDAPSQATHGVLEAFLTLDVADLAEATRLATRALTEATSAEPAIALALEPAGADRPYIDWFVGDRVTAPSPAGVATLYRALSITVNVDDMGDVELGVELNRRTISVEELRTSLLRSLGSGVVGDGAGSKPVSKYLGYGGGAYTPIRYPTSPNDAVLGAPTSDQAGGDEIVFSYPGTVSQLAIAPPWAAPYDLKVYEVLMLATTAGATDVEVDANGSPFDLNGGDTATLTPTAITLVKDATLTVELTSIGSGDVVGLTVIFRYRPV